MTNKDISGLTTAVTPLAGVEVLPIVQGGTTVKATVASIAGAGTFPGNFTEMTVNTGDLTLATPGSCINYANTGVNYGATASDTWVDVLDLSAASWGDTYFFDICLNSGAGGSPSLLSYHEIGYAYCYYNNILIHSLYSGATSNIQVAAGVIQYRQNSGSAQPITGFYYKHSSK